MNGVLFFDGVCGMCTRSVYFLVRHDRTGNVETEPLQSPGVAQRLGIADDQLLEAMRWLDSSGRGLVGGARHPTASAGLPRPRHPVHPGRRLPVGGRPSLPVPWHDAVLRVASRCLLMARKMLCTIRIW
jgi:hypothetical protein